MSAEDLPLDIGNQLLSMSQEAGQAVVAHTVLAHWGTIWVRGQKKRCCLLGYPRQGAQAAVVLLCRRWPGIAVLVTPEHCQCLAPAWTSSTVNTHEMGLLIYHTQVISLPSYGTVC